MAVGAAEILAGSGNRARPRVAEPGAIFGVFIVAGIIALLSIVEFGELKEGVFLALLVFLVFGAFVPPVGIALGLVVIAALLMRGSGAKVFTWLGSLASRPAPAPFAPLGPTVPGYQPAASSSPFAPIAPDKST